MKASIYRSKLGNLYSLSTGNYYLFLEPEFVRGLFKEKNVPVKAGQEIEIELTAKVVKKGKK